MELQDWQAILDIAHWAGGQAMSLFGKSSAEKQFENQQKLNWQAYQLTQRGFRESPLNQRIGYENAGINPILAMSNGGASFGSYSGGTATADSSTADLGNMATNAYKVFSLMRKKNDAEIANIIAGVKNTNADTSLKEEYAFTERQKRMNMEMDRLIAESDYKLKNKELDYSDRMWNAQLKELAERAKSYSGIVTAQLMNAETTRMMNAGNIEEAMRDAEWIKNHPYLHSMGKGLQQTTSNVGNLVGAGVGIYSAKTGRINAMSNATNAYSNGYERYTQRFDSKGNYRGHTREVYTKH